MEKRSQPGAGLASWNPEVEIQRMATKPERHTRRNQDQQTLTAAAMSHTLPQIRFLPGKETEAQQITEEIEATMRTINARLKAGRRDVGDLLRKLQTLVPQRRQLMIP